MHMIFDFLSRCSYFLTNIVNHFDPRYGLQEKVLLIFLFYCTRRFLKLACKKLKLHRSLLAISFNPRYVTIVDYLVKFPNLFLKLLHLLP